MEIEKPFKTIIEPFRIKMVEPLNKLSLSERRVALEKAFYNGFNLAADNIILDFLTDSGTSAMSTSQWAKIMEGDESYAGSRSFYEFEEVVKDLTGHRFIFPTHQGRAAERILFSIMAGKGKIIPNNTHFDTTRANVEFTGAEAVDLITSEAKIPSSDFPFKGNMDVTALEKLIETHGPDQIPLVMITVTNNSAGGQPVSLQNIKEVSAVCKKYKIPLFIDACRFAENAYFIKKREKGQEHRSVEDIAKEIFRLADGTTMSAKKDAFVNIGGFLTLNDEKLSWEMRNLGILTEGYPTYGGLAGRDLGAMAQGLREILNEDYLEYRIASVQYFGKKLQAEGIPIVNPVGGHAVFIDAKAMLPHLQPHQYPAQCLNCEFYIQGGIRGVEIGSLMFGKYKDNQLIPAPMELVRLAIPRRVYTQAHIDYAVEVAVRVKEQCHNMKGLQILEESPYLRHFTAKLWPYDQVYRQI